MFFQSPEGLTSRCPYSTLRNKKTMHGKECPIHAYVNSFLPTTYFQNPKPLGKIVLKKPFLQYEPTLALSATWFPSIEELVVSRGQSFKDCHRSVLKRKRPRAKTSRNSIFIFFHTYLVNYVRIYPCPFQETNDLSKV